MLPSENRNPSSKRAHPEGPSSERHTGRRKILCANERDHRQLVFESLNRLAYGSPHGLLLIDRSWRIIYANKTAQVLARLKPQDLNRVTFWDIYPSILGTSLERALRESATAHTDQQVEVFYYEPFDIWVNVVVKWSEQGLCMYFRDVSPAVKMEAARDLAAQKLDQVLDATTDSVLSVDRDWKISYLNRQARTGLPFKLNILGMNLWEAFPEAVYEGSPHLEHHRRAMDEGIPGDFEAYYPEPLNAWYQVTVRPSKDGIIVFFRDLTKQKLAEAALLEVEKLAVVARLASSIAHEINNPLASVTNLIYLARHRAEIPEVQQYLNLAEQELRRASIMASQSLRFHRQLTSPHPVSSLRLITNVLSVFESRLSHSGVRVETRKRATQPAMCLGEEIGQVLHEIVDNAFASMPTGGSLLVRTREATDWRTGRPGLVLTVADTGTGIAIKDQSRIRDAFFTTKGIGGIGLGLWVSAAIVQRHQGRLRIRSSQGSERHGTVATLFLPFKSAAAA